MIQRAFRYRLRPTPEQAEALTQFAGATRFVYNLAFEQRRDFWRQFRATTGNNLTYVSQSREVTALRAEMPWLAAIHSSPLTQALRDLDRAFAAFFAGRARYPSPRCKGVHDTFRMQGRYVAVRQLNAKWAAVRIPKLGVVKFRISRPMPGRTLNVTFSCRAGDWFVSFSNEIEHEAPANHLPAIGIDRGIANTLALSNGELLSTTDTGKLERRRRQAQRVISRRVRGSQRYSKQRRRFARIAAKIARVRTDWRHKTTTSIADRYGLVAIEALKVVSMTASGRGKRGLNRSILEQGWGDFERVLSYKLDERGGTLVKINPAFTSQECSACGTIDKASRESQSRYACRHCGFADHADINAAKNILRRSTPCVEDAGCGSDEARTINLAA